MTMYLWLSHHFKENTSPYVTKAEAMTMDIVELLKLIGNQNQGRLGNQNLDGRNMVMKGQDPINKCFYFNK